WSSDFAALCCLQMPRAWPGRRCCRPGRCPRRHLSRLGPWGCVMTPIHREEFSMNIRDYVEELLSQFRAQDAVHVWETTGFDHRGREKCWLNLTGALSESVIEPFKQACLSIGADFEPDVFDSARYLFELRCPYDVPIIRWQVPSGPHGRGWTCKPDLGQIVSLILLAAGHSDV